MLEMVVDFSRGTDARLRTPSGGSDGETTYTESECRMIRLGSENARSLERHGMNDVTLTVLLQSDVEPKPDGILVLDGEEYRLRRIVRCINVDGDPVCFRCTAG